MRPRTLFFPMVAILITFGLLALIGCQTNATARGTLKDPLASAPPITHGLDGEGLATLLGAEISGQRGDFAGAAHGYLSQSERYHSAALAQRAALAARLAGDDELLTHAARQWTRLAPEANEPRRLLADMASASGQWQQALAQLLAVDGSGANAGLEAFVQDAADSGAGIPAMIDQLKAHARSHPDRPAALIASALLYSRQGNAEAARATLVRVEQRFADHPSLWLARSQIELEQDRPREALDAARHGQQLAPDDRRFLLARAQAQLTLGRFDRAERRFNQLMSGMPDNVDLRLSLARLYLQHRADAQALRLLTPLTIDQDAPAEALLLSAVAEEQLAHVDRAVAFYRRVSPGQHFIPAQARAAQLLNTHGRFEEALTLLERKRHRYPEQAADLMGLELSLLDSAGEKTRANQRLDRTISESAPDNDELLHLRAMRALEAGRLKAMERDMRTLLKRHPDDASVLNAYGYTLVEQTDRYREALGMLKRAQQIEPDSPAIMDSLGWAWLHLGRLGHATHWLTQAWQAQPDEEIGAHLAEALWLADQPDRARQVVAEVLERFSRHPSLDQLLKRYPQLQPGASIPSSTTGNAQ